MTDTTNMNLILRKTCNWRNLHFYETPSNSSRLLGCQSARLGGITSINIYAYALRFRPFVGCRSRFFCIIITIVVVTCKSIVDQQPWRTNCSPHFWLSNKLGIGYEFDLLGTLRCTTGSVVRHAISAAGHGARVTRTFPYSGYIVECARSATGMQRLGREARRAN